MKGFFLYHIFLYIQMPTAQLSLIGVTQLADARLVTNISKYKL